MLKSDPYFVTNNYVEHFKSIIHKYWPAILNYREKLNQEINITDIGNGFAYKQSKEICNNSICSLLMKLIFKNQLIKISYILF